MENLTSFPVQSLSDIDAYMAKAEKNRSSGRTNMNEHSSRSHMVLYVVVRTTNLQSGVVTVWRVIRGFALPFWGQAPPTCGPVCPFWPCAL